MKTRKLRQLLALLLSLCMMVGILPMGGMVIAADSGEDKWNGSVASAFAGGTGSAADPYQIATGAQLAYLSEQVSGGESYEDKRFVLTADLNLDNRSWEPIGKEGSPFRGSLDGQEHIISKLNISSGTQLGLFGVFEGESIRNLNIQTVKISSNTAEGSGALAGGIDAMATIENCHVRDVTIQGIINGGLVGFQRLGGNQTRTETRYLDCSVLNVTINQIRSDGKAMSGGLVGRVDAHNQGDSFLIENCRTEGFIAVTNSGEYDIYASAGGLFGKIDNGWYDYDSGESFKRADFVIRGCLTDVSIEAPGLASVGGMIAECGLLTLIDCHASGDLNGGSSTGGLVGSGSVTEMESCSASGDVTGTWSVGGLVGAGTASMLRGCYATGNVTANDWHVGGLVGWSPKATLKSCFATGNVTSTLATASNRAGGLLGNGYDCTVTDCYATGNVAGSQTVGGLVGWISNSNNKADGKGSFTNCYSFGKVEATGASNEVLAVPLVYGSWDGDVKVENSYYNSQTSGMEDFRGTDKTLEEFADGSVRELLGEAFVQLDGADCPVLPIEWSGTPRILKSGLYYRISEGKTIHLTPTIKNASGLRIQDGAVLDIRGRFTISDGKQIENHGRILGCLNQTMNHWNSLVDNTSTGSIEEVLLTGGSQGMFFNNAGQIGKITVEGGIFYNYNGGLVKNLSVAGGTAVNVMMNPADAYYELPLEAPVIENAAVTAGRLSNYDNANKMIETPPAIVKKLTADFTQKNIVKIDNFKGGLIEEAVLEGGDGTPALNHDTMFKNSRGGVVNKLSVNGNAGYKIWNSDDSSYGVPVIKELVMDGGYAKFTNENGGRVEKGTIEYNNTFSMNNRASAGDLIVKQSNVLNNYTGSDNPAQACRIGRLFTVSSSSINNWDVGEIGELYIIGAPAVSGVNLDPYGPFAAPGKIGKLYYKIDKAADTPAAFSFGDSTNISTVTDGDDYDDPWPGYGTGSFSGVYGEPEKTIPFTTAYTGDGKLTDVRMNGTELTARADGSYSFTMPYECVMLSAADRALKSDATLSSLTYSVNGGAPIPVPEFTAAGDTYGITLPRSTPRDASVTLNGIPADTDATIAASINGKLVYGATAHQAPASLTVRAEDGAEKNYKVSFYTQSAQADMKDAAIDGIEDGKTFIQNETPAFTAVGSGMENDNPAVDDERHRPAFWKIDDGAVLSGSWNGVPFTGSLDLSKLSKGTHTLTVTYNWERFGELYENGEPTGEYGWSVLEPDSPDMLVKTVSFTVNPVTYALTVVNGTDQTGGSPYEAGANVSIEAAAPPAGYVFDKWELTSGEGTFADVSKTGTVFTMGAGDATVTATYKDVEAPTGEITIAANGWKQFLHTITFGLFYQDSQDVAITAADTAGETVRIEYLLSAEALTLDEVQGKTEGWAAYTGKFSVDPDREFIVYARLTDKAGNMAYLSSDGVVLDATAPVVLGADNGETYDKALNITVTDQYLETVTVNGEVRPVENGSSAFALTENGTYTLYAKDKAGNETTVVVTIDIPPETYTLAFDTDGGAPVPAVQTLTAGATPAAVTSPTKEGYTFLGWYNDDNEKVDLPAFEMPENDVTLKAWWEKTDPTDPTDPSNPTTSTDPSHPAKPSDPSDNPHTGNDFPAWPFWLALLSLCGIGGTLLSARRRKAKDK